jgi:hypothetical protein
MKSRFLGVAVLVAFGLPVAALGQGMRKEPELPPELINPQRKDKEQPARERAPERGGLIDLRPKWEKGQQVRYALELRNASTDDLKKPPTPGQPRGGRNAAPGRTGAGAGGGAGLRDNESRSRVELGLLFTVKEVNPDKVATVDLTIERLKLAVATPVSDLEFDSTRAGKAGPAGTGEDDVIAMALKPIVGTTMTMTVDRDGTIRSITGGEALALLGGITPGAAAAAGSGGMPQLFGPIFSGRPAKGEARIGESWEYDDGLQTGLIGDLKMRTTHTLTGLRGSDAVITIRGQIEPRTEAPGSSAFQVKDSSYSGQYLWDTGRGQLSQMETTMTVRLDGKSGDQDMSTRNEATVRITRTRAP